MLNIKRFLATAAMVATLVSATLAASPVGSWAGRLVIDNMPKLPANATPEQKKQIQTMLDQVKKYRISLVIKSNKSFNVSAPAMGPMPAQTAEGTWTQIGTKLTLKTTKENGKPATGPNAKPQDFTYSADGKTITSTKMGMGKIIFTRK